MFKELAYGIGGGLIAVGAYGVGSYFYNKSRNQNIDKLIDRAKADGIIEQSESEKLTTMKDKFLNKFKKAVEKEKAQQQNVSAKPAESEVKVFKTEEPKKA